MVSIPRMLSPRACKLIAIAVLSAPVALILLMGIGEVAGGDLTGAAHFLEALPLLLVLLLAWRFPRPAGLVLVWGGGLLAVVYLFNYPSGISFLAAIATELMLFVPPVAAGLLLLLAARRQQEAAAPVGRAAAR